MSWRAEDRPTFPEISYRLAHLLTSVNDRPSFQDHSAEAMTAGLYQRRSTSRPAVMHEEEDGVRCQPVWQKGMLDGPPIEALSTIRRQYPVFQLQELLKGKETTVGEGMYGSVYLQNITLTARLLHAASHL